MRRALEMICGHIRQLLVLLTVPLVLSLAVAYFLPRTYEAVGTIWALRRYTVIGATGPESNLLATPASTQASAIAELLQTRAFALAVANESGVASTLSSSVQVDPQQRDDALYQDMSTHVLAVDRGYNLVEISYSSPDPQVAQQVVQAAINDYGAVSASYAATEAQRLLTNYQGQLTQAKQSADAAAQALAQYVQQHPQDTNQQAALADPQFQLLSGQAQQTRATVASLQDTITSINQQLSTLGKGSDQLFLVVDSPIVPERPVSRLKTLGLGGGIGLALALLACALYVIVLMRHDRAIYDGIDLAEVTPLPIVMQLPRLTTRNLLLAKQANGYGRS